MPRLTAALDISTTTSAYGEGFPNVVGEAMACAVPCAVTDVGDSALIVHDTGKVVPPRDPSALAEAWHALVALGAEGRRKLGAAARQRVERNFSLPVVVARYQSLYEELALGKKAPRRRRLSPESKPLAS
jgi:glycosyltransferase involved in cell wall biosynthesis